MAQDPLQRLVPQAPRALCDILDGARGPAEAPIRSEVFGPQRFAQHGRSLGEAHLFLTLFNRCLAFFFRLQLGLLLGYFID